MQPTTSSGQWHRQGSWRRTKNSAVFWRRTAQSCTSNIGRRFGPFNLTYKHSVECYCNVGLPLLWPGKPAVFLLIVVLGKQWSAGGQAPIKKVLGTYFYAKNALSLRETLKLSDGGHVCLDWCNEKDDMTDSESCRPTVIILPGAVG